MNQETLHSCLEKCFEQISAPRVERTRAHQLLDILATALFAMLAGADSWVAIETDSNDKRSWLATFLALPKGMPSHDTFARLNPVVLEAGCQQWIGAIVS